MLTYDFTWWTNRLGDGKPIRRNVSKDLFWGSPLVWQTRREGGDGGRYNSISSRWPPIKGDEWEPFNGPSVNLHPHLSSPLFNPFHQHPWNKEHSLPLSRHLLSLARVNDAPTLPLLHDETCPWIPSSFSLHPLSTLGRLLVSLVTPRRAYVIRQPERTKNPPSRILSNVSIEFWGCFSLERDCFRCSLLFLILVQVSTCCFEGTSYFCHAIPSQSEIWFQFGFEISFFPLNGKRVGRLV